MHAVNSSERDARRATRDVDAFSMARLAWHEGMDAVCEPVPIEVPKSSEHRPVGPLFRTALTSYRRDS